MATKRKVSTAKNAPLVKELYALLVNQKAMPDDKPADVWEAFKSKGYKELDASCFCNAWNKAKKCSWMELPCRT